MNTGYKWAGIRWKLTCEENAQGFMKDKERFHERNIRHLLQQ